MERQMNKISNVITFRGQQLVRREFGEINNIIREYAVNTYDEELGEVLKYHVEYRWESSSDACKICKRFNNKLLNYVDMSKIHYNCRCNIVKIEWYENSKGQKLKYLRKIIT